MKKAITAILAILYFSVSSGIVFNIHYCKDKVSSVQIDLLAKELCGCTKKGKKSEKKNCCKTEHKVIKLQNDHKTTVTDYVLKAPITLFTSSYHLVDVYFNETPTAVAYSFIPPLLSEQHIHIKNCVFRI
ncbi:MAG: hypothetical protein KF781_01270 [Chitinophagaceae bacterium]|nr:hypothetical protein [Chitinophagaceae bacterium]MCW5905365.1 hypothetical protein [Chitinophagaceae bacterium]